jgi:hypothetical protein
MFFNGVEVDDDESYVPGRTGVAVWIYDTPPPPLPPLPGEEAGAAGVTAVDAVEAGLLPIAFVAITVKVYEVPLVSPVMSSGLVVPVAVRLPGEEVTV